MNIIEYHNYFRSEKELIPLVESNILNEYALKNAKWMARRKFHCFWNFDKVRERLIDNYYILDFNIAVGYTEDIVMKHILNNIEKSQKIYSDFTSIGVGSFETQYKHWVILYGK